MKSWTNNFETNVWDERLSWNSLIHPQMTTPLKFKNRKKHIMDKTQYRERLTGEIEFDLKNDMRSIRRELAEDQTVYDRMKAHEIPYGALVKYAIIYLVVMAFVSFVGLQKFPAISVAFLVWANVLFFILQSMVVLMITYYMFRQDEVETCRKLCVMSNEMKGKQRVILSRQKQFSRMRAMNDLLTYEDRQRNFQKNYNLVRIEALRLWCSEGHLLKHSDMLLRIQEIAFYNAGFLARLYTEMCGAVDFEASDSSTAQIQMICDAFAVHSVILAFGKQQLQNETFQKHYPLCRDNLAQCMNKASGLVQSQKFESTVEAISGIKSEDIQLAFQDGVGRAKLTAAMLKKLPYADFKKSYDVDHVQEKPIDFSQITFKAQQTAPSNQYYVQAF